jgi:hypothetical protein
MHCILGTYVLCLSPYHIDALLIRTGRSRAISCHSRNIGVECLLFCNHYKDNGRGYVQYHDSERLPVCVD